MSTGDELRNKVVVPIVKVQIAVRTTAEICITRHGRKALRRGALPLLPGLCHSVTAVPPPGISVDAGTSKMVQVHVQKDVHTAALFAAVACCAGLPNK